MQHSCGEKQICDMEACTVLAATFPDWRDDHRQAASLWIKVNASEWAMRHRLVKAILSGLLTWLFGCACRQFD